MKTNNTLSAVAGTTPAAIGIFGGSFNPIHLGHIALAKEMRRQLHLDEVWLMVTPLNPFKAKATNLLPDSQRLALAREALRNEPHIHARDDEFRMLKPSYTWQTLQTLTKEHPDKQFTLIIGADNWLAFDRWRNYQDILSHYPVAIYPRQGYPVDPATLPTPGDSGYPRVTLVDTRLYPVSSTQIRERVARRQSLLGLVPRHIIRKVRALYRAANRRGDSSAANSQQAGNG